MNEKNKTNKKGRIVLIDDPLMTKDINLLEEILSKTNGKQYLNAVQFGSLGGNYGIFSDSNKEPLNEYLPGGIVIRKRYDVNEIRKRYNKLKTA